MATGEKAPGAFRTIGELSQELGVAQHVLRYWETRFPQLKPLQRSGNRRYYRPADVELARTINRLLNEEGYTVRGVQKLLRESNGRKAPIESREPLQVVEQSPRAEEADQRLDMARLRALRDTLAEALRDS